MRTPLRLSRFSHVLHNRDFLRLWAGQIISQLGDRLSQMALIAYIYMRAPGSSFEIAKVLSFTILPVFLIGPIAGVYVDRWDRRKTMFIADIVRSALVLVIPLFLFHAKSLVPMYVMIFLMFCVGRFFVPAKMAIIPDLADKEDLVMANSLVNITGMIAAVLGFGVSGVLVEKVGPRSGFFLDSLSFLVSATLIFLISKRVVRKVRVRTRTARAELADVIRVSVFQELKEGLLYFVKVREIRFTAAIIFVLWSALGAIYVVGIVFVQKTLHSATKDLGLLAMFIGIGLFLGSVVYGKTGKRFSEYKTIFVSLILSGLMLISFAVFIHRYPYFAVAAALACGLGCLVAPIMIASNTIVHNSSEHTMRGKIFSSLEIVMHLGFLLAMFVSSALAERMSHLAVLVGVGCLFGGIGAFNLIFYKKLPWSD